MLSSDLEHDLLGKIILMVLGLAIFGAYTLVERFAPAPTTAADASYAATERATAALVAPSVKSLAASLTESTVDAMLQSAGLTFQGHPAGGEGCSQSILSAAQLQELMAFMPPPQQDVIGKVLNTSAPIWMTQLYAGRQGYGVCLPMQEKVLLLPAAAQEQVQTLLSLLPN